MEEKNTNKTVKKKYGKRVIIVLLFILFFAIYSFVSLKGQYLEMLEIGEEYLDVFWTNVNYKYITLLVNFFIIFLAIYITTLKIKNGLKKFFVEEKKEIPKLPNKSISLIIATIFSILISSFVLDKLMLCLNNSLFGITDPIFNIDIAFYIFQKPFIEFIITYFIVLILGLTIYSVIYYIVVFNTYFDGVNRETLKNSSLFKQIYINIMLIIIAVSVLTILNTQNIINDEFLTLTDEARTDLVGAGLIDVTIKLWGYRILAIVMIISIYMAIKFFKKNETKKVILSISAVPIYLVSLFIIMISFDFIFVKSNELDKEQRYIAYNIEYTKNAYNINIEEKDLNYTGTLTAEQVTEYENILKNIPLIDEETTLKTLQEYQTNSKLYSFYNTSINKYKINGEDKLVYVTPREIISNGNRTYDNKTYEYTHGYSAIISSATEVDEQGNITYIQKNFAKDDEQIYVNEPRIYFGLETDSTIITNTKNKQEFDYPITSLQNAENSYDGKAGLNLNFIDRLVLSITQKDINLLFSSEITQNSKILINRNIIDRAKTILPYLMYDEEPYMVVTKDGRLVWVLDAYTTSNSYPYSQKTTLEIDDMKQQINYIRNSIKVLIDAYDGTVTFYITDRTDPIAMAYRNIYPTLFKDIEGSLLENIKEYINYPEFLYNIQSEIITMYHNVQTDVLYRTDDIWDIATHSKGKISNTTGTYIQPQYTLVKTKDMEEAKLGLILPYTPINKQNIISYLIGTTDNSNNKLVLYKFSTDSNILGPMQLDTQIEQDEIISKELETLNVTGTKLAREMITLPIEETLIYIEPIYQVMLNESNVPILKKVIVASGNKVAIGNDLKEALNNLLSQYAVDIEIENTDNVEDLIEAIIKANNNLTTSNDNNDWEMVGKDIQKLQELIKKLEIVVEEETKEEQENNNITNELIVENVINNNV